MSILLTCDAPDCTETTPAVPVHGRIAGPGNWWVSVVTDGISVACCTTHLLRSQRLKRKASRAAAGIETIGIAGDTKGAG